MTGSIEFAQLNAKVIEGIEQGNAALDALNKACSIERVEEVSTPPPHTHTYIERERLYRRTSFLDATFYTTVHPLERTLMGSQSPISSRALAERSISVFSSR